MCSHLIQVKHGYLSSLQHLKQVNLPLEEASYQAAQDKPQTCNIYKTSDTFIIDYHNQVTSTTYQ